MFITTFYRPIGEPEKGVESTPKGSPVGSSKTEERIIDIIRRDPKISTMNVGKKLGISKRAVLKQIAKLKEEDRIIRIGPAKGGRWKIIEKDVDRDIEKDGRGSPISSPVGSSKTEEMIIDLIKDDPTISTRRIGEILGISKRAVLKQISKLKSQGNIHRIGPARGGHWEIITEKEESET